MNFNLQNNLIYTSEHIKKFVEVFNNIERIKNNDNISKYLSDLNDVLISEDSHTALLKGYLKRYEKKYSDIIHDLHPLIGSPISIDEYINILNQIYSFLSFEKKRYTHVYIKNIISLLDNLNNNKKIKELNKYCNQI